MTEASAQPDDPASYFFGQVELSHATLADLLEDFVMAKGLAEQSVVPQVAVVPLLNVTP